MRISDPKYWQELESDCQNTRAGFGDSLGALHIARCWTDLKQLSKRAQQGDAGVALWLEASGWSLTGTTDQHAIDAFARLADRAGAGAGFIPGRSARDWLLDQIRDRKINAQNDLRVFDRNGKEVPVTHIVRLFEAVAHFCYELRTECITTELLRSRRPAPLAVGAPEVAIRAVATSDRELEGSSPRCAADGAEPGTASPAKSNSPYSGRDHAVYLAVGEERFRTLTNVEILRRYRSEIRKLLNIRPGKQLTADAGGSMLTRIRKHWGFEMSDQIRKKAVRRIVSNRQ